MTWWPLAWSAELTSRPVAVVRGDSAIVLYRGVGGAALALEDRCPHRRAPLSLGRVTESGMLQCGYHGWTFDGGSGRKYPIYGMTSRCQPLLRRIVIR